MQPLCTCFYQGSPFAPSNETGLAHMWQAFTAAPVTDRVLVAVFIVGAAAEILGGALSSTGRRIRNNFQMDRTRGLSGFRISRRRVRPGVYVTHKDGGYSPRVDWTARVTQVFTRYDHRSAVLRRSVLVMPVTDEMAPQAYDVDDLTVITARQARANISTSRHLFDPMDSNAGAEA